MSIGPEGFPEIHPDYSISISGLIRSSDGVMEKVAFTGTATPVPVTGEAMSGVQMSLSICPVWAKDRDVINEILAMASAVASFNPKLASAVTALKSIAAMLDKICETGSR